MTNIQPMTEQVSSTPTEELALIAGERGRRPKQAWRLMLPSLTAWLIAGLALVGSIIVFGTFAPFFVGDADAPRFVNPGNFPQDPSHRMKLAETRQIGDCVLLRYLPR